MNWRQRGFVTALAVWFLCFGFASHSSGQTVTVLQSTGDSGNRIDIVILGDGYTSAEMGKFAADASQFANLLLAQEPFLEYRNYFNIRRIDVVSSESGSDHPDRTPQVFRDTAFDSTFNCAGIQRLICASGTKINNAISVLTPTQRDVRLLLVNDPEYGGSGGVNAISSTNVQGVEIMLHEIGHSLGLLIDEYVETPSACDDSAEPSVANATREVNRASIKWTAWISASTTLPTPGTELAVPGLYPGVANCLTTLYRPTYNSKMRSLNRPFEQINSEQLIRRFYAFVNPIDGATPASTLSLVRGQTQQFTVTLPSPRTHSITVTWSVDGQQRGAGSQFTLDTLPLLTGNHTVTASAQDETVMVRNDPSGFLRDQQTWNITVTSDPGVRPYTITNSGGTSVNTTGAGALATGYARIQPEAGNSTPTGIAVFGYRQNGILVSEAGVPGQPLLTSARIYAEVSADRSVNTGLAIVNPNAQAAILNYTFTDTAGNDFKTGTTSIPAGGQISSFLDEQPYLGGTGIQGAFSFTSSQPVSAITLRGLTNERQPRDFLMTTMPVVDPSAIAGASVQVIPHFAAGQGWTTQILLVNPTSTDLTGTLEFFGPGSPSAAATPIVVEIDGQPGSNALYLVKGRSSRKLVVRGIGGDLASGSIRVTPGATQAAPVSLVVFSYKPASITVSEASVPVTMGTTFRMYVEASSVPFISAGIAIANPTNAPVPTLLELTRLDGSSVASTGITLPASGQRVGFLTDFFPSLTLPFQGVLRIASSAPQISVVGLRARLNERTPSDFLITTTTPSLENAAPETTPRFFPIFANGEGYTSQFILFSGTSGQTAIGSLRLLSNTGAALDLPVN